MRDRLSISLVVDLPGHILERIGRNWACYATGVHHEIIPSKGIDNFTLCRHGEQFDLVHWIDLLRFIPCASGVRVPQIAMVHHLTEDMLESAIPALSYCDGITTGAQEWQHRLEKELGRPAFLIPYTVDSAQFTPASDQTGRKQSVGLTNRFVLGFVGKATADHAGRKGINLLLEVLRAASQRWSDLALVLVGPGWDRLSRSIEELGILVKRFEYATTEETVQAYWLMDVLLVTSKVEGGPCTILEAMASGVPVITSLVGHVPEVIIDGQTGFICQGRKVEEYIQALASLREDFVLRTCVINQAKEFIVRERDDRVVIPRVDFVSLYSNAIAHYRSRSATDVALRRLRQGKWLARHWGRQVLGKGGSR